MDEMKNNRKCMLNTAALVDLKAELIRKQDLLKKDRVQRGYDIEIKSLKLKNDTGKLQVPLRGTSKKSLDNEKLTELQEEEEKQLKRSREMLEQKTKLYEQMSTGETQLTEEESELYMVDFSKKTVFDGLIHQKPVAANNQDNNKEEEDVIDDIKDSLHNADWVNFIDKYGKRRTCLREDLPFYQDSNKVPTFNLNLSNSLDNVPKVEADHPKESESVGPIHYQNVRNKEVRAHGVGYFAFSENEQERQKQMEMLKNMRKQTIKQRDLKERAKEKRTALLKARLDKVRHRKNIEKQEDNEEQDSDEEQSLADIPLPNEMLKGNNEKEIEPRPFRLRPWDKGKDFSQVQIPKFESPKLNVSSHRYVDKRREERLNDFAPPDIYSKKPKSDTEYGNFKSGGQWQPKSSSHSTAMNYNFTDCDNVEQSENSPNVENSDNIEDMVARQLRMFRNNLFQK